MGSDKPRSSPVLMRAFPFPPAGPKMKETDGFLLCRNSNCQTCARSPPPESAALHHYCLVIFARKCGLPMFEALKLLRTIVLFRRPWFKAFDVCLVPGNGIEQSDRISPNSDLVRLRSLPPELRGMIKTLSPHAWFWRTLNIFDLFSHVSSNAAPQQVFALNDVENWERGGYPIFASKKEEPSFLRITIDSAGIKSVNRLQERPIVSHQTSRYEAYIVEDTRALSGVKACLKVYIYSKQC